MSTLKKFLIWLLAVIALYIFTNIIINVYIHPDKIGGTIYNWTHKNQVVNQTK